MLIGMTRMPGAKAVSRARAGNSATQGAHQVAHRLTSTKRPLKPESWKRAPLSSAKATSGAALGVFSSFSAAKDGGGSMP